MYMYWDAWEERAKCLPIHIKLQNNLPSDGHAGGGQGKNLHKLSSNKKGKQNEIVHPVKENEGCSIKA